MYLGLAVALATWYNLKKDIRMSIENILGNVKKEEPENEADKSKTLHS